MREPLSMILAIAVLVGFSGVGPVEARRALPHFDTWEVARDTITCVTITVSSSVPSNVTSTTPNVRIASASAVTVYNQHPTVLLGCGFQADVSSITGNGTYGREISGKSEKLWQYNTDRINLFCIGHGTNTVNRATICQFR